MAANYNQHFGQGTNVLFDNPVKGQPALTLIDPLKQIALRPDIREGKPGEASIVMPYADSGWEGLFSQLTSMLGGNGYRTVSARKFYWAQYEQLDSLAFGVSKSLAGVPSGGTPVTVKFSRLSMTANGNFVKAIAGFPVFIKENGNQIANVTAVIPNASGDFSITLAPINGEVLDLTVFPTYTLVLAPMKAYKLDSTHDIKGHGVAWNPPILWQSQVQKYEDRIDIDESEIDNYVYNKKWTMAKGVNSDETPVDFVYNPAIYKLLNDRILGNRTLLTLLNQYNATEDEGFEGVIPSVRKYGMFNMSYDALLNASFTSLLMNMIKSIRKINGSNEYMLLHSFNFGIDWSQAIGKMVSDYGQNVNYSLFGAGGVGVRNFEYFQFRDWAYGEYKFKAKLIEAFDSPRFGQILPYFGMLIPAKQFQDTEGRTVPWMTYTNVVGAEPAKAWETWAWDFRRQGGRLLSIFAKDAFGIEVHALTTAGIIEKSSAS